MPPPQFFDQFAEDLAHKVHNLGSDTLRLYLTNTEPSASADEVRADLPAEISAGFGYAANGPALTVSGSAQTSGTYKLTITDYVLTASGGAIGPFRYAVIYNDTPTSPADPLICYYDFGAAATILDTTNRTFDFDASAGVLTLVLP